MKIHKRVLVAAGLFLATAAAPVMGDEAEGDAERGEKLFGQQCKACHNLTEGATPDMYGVVLPLHGILGKEAAQVPGFFYSKAMRESGVVWTEELMDKYIEDPKGTIPGIRMEFIGIEDPQDRADIIAHIKATQTSE